MKPTTLPLPVLAIVLLLAAGCGSDPLNESDDDDDTGVAQDDDDDASDEPTWNRVQQLFDSECDRCHTSNTQAQLTDLDDYDAGYEILVNQPSHQLPQMMRVSPGDPENSYLLHKLQGTHLDIGGEDDPMPPEERDPLDGEELQLVEEWILAGALKN